MSVWCQRNQLILNSKKTCFLNPHIKKPLPKSFSANIELSSQIKFLGTRIDENLSWDVQIEHVASKLSSCYFAIVQLRSVLDMNGLINVYYALGYSHIAYNIVTWGGTSDLSRILVLQKRILRLILNLEPLTSCKPFFKKHNLLTADAIFIYKCVLFV